MWAYLKSLFCVIHLVFWCCASHLRPVAARYSHPLPPSIHTSHVPSCCILLLFFLPTWDGLMSISSPCNSSHLRSPFHPCLCMRLARVWLPPSFAPDLVSKGVVGDSDNILSNRDANHLWFWPSLGDHQHQNLQGLFKCRFLGWAPNQLDQTFQAGKWSQESTFLTSFPGVSYSL